MKLFNQQKLLEKTHKPQITIADETFAAKLPRESILNNIPLARKPFINSIIDVVEKHKDQIV